MTLKYKGLNIVYNIFYKMLICLIDYVINMRFDHEEGKLIYISVDKWANSLYPKDEKDFFARLYICWMSKWKKARTGRACFAKGFN